jgi:diguanylate cyclase (GGDEF)-like protein
MADKYQILVIDDDEIDRMAIARVLRKAGIPAEIEQAGDGAAGLEALRSKSFDCAFLDYQLPPSNGLKVLREARSSGIEVPIVMLTGEGDELLVAEVMRAGASDYLSKAVLSPEIITRTLQFVTRMYQAEQAQRRLASFPEQAPTPILEVDESGNITYLNPAAAEVFPDIEEVGAAHSMLKAWSVAIRPLLSGENRSITREVRVGRSYYHQTISRVPGRPLLRIYAIDITERKLAEELLVHNAYYDPLTDLPNRTLFSDRLGRALEREKRHKDQSFAVLFLDLDRFKIINDSLGHLSGDQLLVATADRLRTCVRSEDTVARFGGDEFAVLIESPRDMSEVTRIAERILGEFERPFKIEEREVYTTTSIGIALSETGYSHADELLRDADNAMYRAKAEGGAQFQVFDSKMHEQAMAMLQLHSEPRYAIVSEQLHLYYQPVISLHDGRLVGFEALVRWDHPQNGIIEPDAFIRAAEETGLILEIDRWVLSETFRQRDEWCTKFGDTLLPVISVNISNRLFYSIGLEDELRRLIRGRASKSGAGNLVLEISVATVMSDLDAALETMTLIKELGIQITADDFGTGHSSLGRLRRLPIDSLKIDRSIVSEMAVNADSLQIARATIGLAKTLGLKVIAKGVETREQYEVITEAECDFAQGFWFAKPMTAAAAEKLIQENPHWPGDC